MPIKRETNQGLTAPERVKRSNMLHKQRIAAIIIFAAVLLLIAALAVVLYVVDIYSFEDINGDEYLLKKIDGVYALCYKDGEVCGTVDFQSNKCYITAIGTIVYVDGESGKTTIKVVPETEGTEIQYYEYYVSLFNTMTYDENAVKEDAQIIESIEVHNSEGSYKFVRDENYDFVIEGHTSAPYSLISFAQFANTCGSAVASRRLENPVLLEGGAIDYAEYGLAGETRERVELDADGKESVVEYEYTPTYYVITAKNGDYHKILVGDVTVTGDGYYAKYEGGVVKGKAQSARDTVYVLSITEIALTEGYNGYELLVGRLENFITPRIVYPMGLTEYFNVKDFAIYGNIDYKSIYAALAEKFGEADAGSEEFLEEYTRLFEQYSKKVCDFSFYDMSERSGTMNAYVPYISNLEYTAGYYLNGDNVDLMLQGFYETEFVEVVRLSPTDEELDSLGLLDPAFVVSYLFKTENEKGEEVYVENHVEISERQSGGIYYAYASSYDMIVSVKESSFAFLEWDETYWYDENYIQLGISNIDSILIESPAFSTEFEIEDSASKYLGYIAQSGRKIVIGEKEYVIEKNEQGKYVLKSSGEALTPFYSGDYLITPVSYSGGERADGNYIFSEASEVDSDGDGTNDAVLYYFYDVVYNQGEYYLIAQVLASDMNGNQLGEGEIVMGQKAYESSYFKTRNGFLFFASKGSSIGQKIEAIYGRYNRGSWSEGSLFITSKGTNVFIDKKTGEWVIIDGVSCGVYLADSQTSRLAERAVSVPALYDESGNLKRYPDTFYPMTDKKMQYNEESGTLQAYNKVKKEWETLLSSECTIGVWGECEYYVLEGGICLLVDSATGDFGEVSVLSNPTYVADIVAGGELLDYVIEREGFTSSSKTATAMQNFQEFYKYFLTASFEGLASLSEEEKAAFRALDDFTSGENEACVLKITVKASDFKGNEREVVYRFYRYSERRAYLTVEVLDGTGSSSEKAYGSFDVLYSFVRKVIEDAEKVIGGEPVYSSEKY